jgi:signal transduction histidine kinase
MLHPEIETEDDMRSLLSGHEELARLLLEDPESDRCEMSERVFEELTTLRELHERRELEEAKRALEEKDRQKDQFIAVLAHELRNPLATIRLATDALTLMGLKDQNAVPLLERLDRQSTAMSRMLEDLLDASRIALGKVSVTLENIDLDRLLANALDEQQLRVQKAGLRLVRQLKSEAVIVKADRVRLRQIVDNLLANAIKFTPAGGHIEVSFAREEACAVVRVRDSGIGFDPGVAQKLFEPFTQIEQDRNRPAGGLGLGLAIASRLARLQGGGACSTQ